MSAGVGGLERIVGTEASLILTQEPPDLEVILGKGKVKRFLGKHVLAPTHKPLRQAYEDHGKEFTWAEIRSSPRHILYLAAAGYIIGELPGDIQKPITQYLGLPQNALTMANLPWALIGTAESALWLYGGYRASQGTGVDSMLSTVALSGVGLYKAASNVLFNPPRFYRSWKKNEAIGTAAGIVGLALLPYYAARGMRRAYLKRQNSEERI
jgi:hypothetical protein